MDSPVVHFQIATHDPEGMAKFLREVFEWDVDATADQSFSNIATGWSDDIRVAGSMLKIREGSHPFVSVYVRVHDLDATVERARERGAQVRVPRARTEQGTDIAIIAHPEGQVFGVVQL